MADTVYYVRSRGRVSGPFDLSGLQKLIRRGRLSRSDQVSPDKATWSSAGEFEELFPLRGAAAVASAVTASAEGGQVYETPGATSALTEPSALSHERFFYSQSGATVGPLPLGVLRALAENGTLRAADMVWQENAEVAAPACQVTHLADIYSAYRSRGEARPRSTRATNPDVVRKAVRAAAVQALSSGVVVAGLILLLLMLPVFRFEDRTVWWWDALSQARNGLLSIMLIYHVGMAIAVAIVVPLTKGVVRSTTVLSLAGVGLALWMIASLRLASTTSSVLLSLGSLMVPVFAGSLLAVLHFRALKLDSNRGRIIQGMLSGLLAVFSLSVAVVLLVEIADGIGPVPGWVIAVIVMMLVGAVVGIAGAILGLVGTASEYSYGVNLAAIICCILTIALVVSSSATFSIGVANIAAVLGELSDVLGNASMRDGGIGGWIAFCFIRLVVLFYGLVVLLGSALLELLVNASARELRPAAAQANRNDMSTVEFVPLSWVRQDVEQRIGVHGGRFTRTNSVFTFALAVTLTAAFYASLLPFQGHYFVRMFTERGYVQYITMVFSFWALAILFVKIQKLRLQRRALHVRVVPEQPDFVLSSVTAADVLAQLHKACDDPKQFYLLNRIELALSNLRNMGRISDLADVLQSQASNDEDVMESSYSLVRGLIWAIPVLGFIGTVQGLSQAVGNFGSVLSDAAEVSALKPALRGVTAGLAIAFETTFVALIAALAIQLLLTMIKHSEEQLLDDCKEYCQRQLVARLRITPFD